jgi:predicted MFS family arabinose efflux permease
MSRRWSPWDHQRHYRRPTGQVLDRINFPINYQVVFLALSVGALISYYFSSRIQIPDSDLPASTQRLPIRQRITQAVREYYELVRHEPNFVNFSLKRLVFLFGVTLAAPIFPLYFVREVQATNAWIGIIATSQTIMALIGYTLWTRQSRLHGSRRVLMLTTLGMSLFPAMVASTHQVSLPFSPTAGIFQAGLDLVFFDELMKTVPIKYSATFVSLAQSMQYLSTILSPLIGTWIADHFSLTAALLTSAAIRLIGFGLFALQGRQPIREEEEDLVQV